MLVGENRPAIHNERGSVAFAFASLPTITILLPDGEYLDPAPTVTDISAVPGYDEDNLIHKLSAPVNWEQGGAYTLRWFLVQAGQNPIIREEIYFAAWTDVYAVIRSQGYLNRTPTQLPDAVLDPLLAGAARELTDTAIGLSADCFASYNDLTGSDRVYFDEALAYMVSAFLRPHMGRLASDGDLVKRRQGDTEYTWGDRSKGAAESVEAGWMRNAELRFRRISCVAAFVAAMQSSRRLWSLSGRSRAAEKAGYIFPTVDALSRYLVHEDRRLQGIGVYP